MKDLDFNIPAKSPPEWAQNLDMDAYLKRQGEACIYMKEVLNNIRGVYPEFMLQCLQISDVHDEQYRLISERVPLGLATVSIQHSFYFTWLYKELGVERPSDNPRRYLLVHVIGYLRGHERYNRLMDAGREHGSLWNLFQGHAKENARKLLTAVVQKEGVSSVAMTWAVVADAEDRLMRLIWKHNGLPDPPRMGGEPGISGLSVFPRE